MKFYIEYSHKYDPNQTITVGTTLVDMKLPEWKNATTVFLAEKFAELEAHILLRDCSEIRIFTEDNGETIYEGIVRIPTEEVVFNIYSDPELDYTTVLSDFFEDYEFDIELEGVYHAGD